MTEDNWISVKKKLPGKDSPVLVYDPELNQGITTAIFNGKNFVSISGSTPSIYNSATHWMSLPEPPLDES